MRHVRALVLAAAAIGLVAGCGDDDEQPAGGGGGAEQEPEVELRGVDMQNKVLSIGMLNGESGPAAVIGVPYAVGKRILAAEVNAGGSGLLPDGWTVRLVERDHAYNPQQSVQHYNAIKNEVLFIGTSFGTPNTLPLRDMLERDEIVAFPASLSSEMARHRWTPPLGPSYRVEAMRAMDWVVAEAGGAGDVKAAIVYQQDDYGTDGLEGWRAAAQHHGVTIVSEQAVAAGQQDVTAVVTALEDAGATHVLLTILPSATGPVLGTAAQLGFTPVWIGNTPAWIDRFFDPEVIPPAVFGKFHLVTGLTYWAEEVPGMDRFVRAYERHGRNLNPPDFYILMSYVQGLAELEAFERALESGQPVTGRAYLERGVQGMSEWNAGGLIQPIDLSRFPYVTSTRTRILKPKMGDRTWEEVAPYASPAGGGG
jgi:ABC-type branched-subunit amino acid transport system substrate-binding protein